MTHLSGFVRHIVVRVCREVSHEDHLFCGRTVVITVATFTFSAHGCGSPALPSGVSPDLFPYPGNSSLFPVGRSLVYCKVSRAHRCSVRFSIAGGVSNLVQGAKHAAAYVFNGRVVISRRQVRLDIIVQVLADGGTTQFASAKDKSEYRVVK